MSVDATTAVVVTSGSGFAINVGGAVAPASWPAGYIPTSGDAVNVLRVDDRLFVLGPVTTNPRPISGTVAGSASGGYVPVTVTVGPSPIQCRYTGTAPTVGTLVFLDWQATVPRLWTGAAATVTPPPDPDPVPTPPPPPPPPQTGTNSFGVIDAASWRPGYGRWDSGSVIQWRYGSESESRGAWFLGLGPTQLKGRTITAMRFRPVKRLHIGSYNATLSAHFYLLSNRSRPSGDASRIDGPFDVAVGPGFNGALTLPAAWGQYLADHGGGIGLNGSPYLGFNPSGSSVALTWTR